MSRSAQKHTEAPMSEAFEPSSLFSGSNAVFLAHLYAKFLENPSNVNADWAQIFSQLDDDAKTFLTEIQQAPEMPKEAISRDFDDFASEKMDKSQALLDATRVAMLIRSYQVRGHLLSRLDPLNLEKREYHKELDPRSYGFGPKDFDRPIFLGGALGRKSGTLREVYDRLHQIYTGPIGVEYMHIQDPDQKLWIQKHIENVEERESLTTEDKKAILYELIRADQFERFLQTKFPGAKRFSLEGCESTMAALEQILLQASKTGVQEIVFGMAHRGRLNVLANVIGKPIRAIVSEFEGGLASTEGVQGSGDVKYHLGCSSDREINTQIMHLSLTANPSHLEAVDPVVVGKVRAKQEQRKDKDREQVVGLLIHGDAAFAGQGLVAETLSLSELPGYRVGGTLHLVINNQIGFTTSPKHSRSSPYCSDVAKMIQAPIFHVNGDDPEAVAYVSRLAMDFRQKFKKDVIIDLFGYRRYGHNEMDEPAFTQPLMYKAIAEQIPVKDKYKQYLIENSILIDEEAEELENKYLALLKEEFATAEDYKPRKADWLDGIWTGFDIGNETNRDGNTAVSMKMLQDVGRALTKYPDGFHIHKRLDRILKEKRENVNSGENIDWATAEALAFGTLLCEGSPVRLSGQDSCRGTFSQRHGVFIDQINEAKYTPLNNIGEGQAMLQILDSSLSEASVLGFEYGYSLANPHGLVIWEAQFGDFANGAQVIIDQFICSGEAKWLRMSGLVMLLPHGYEGQGPEHSSARLERFLQLSAEYNWQIVNCTTPANYFHVLRRQLRRNIRKPLVVMTPKGFLRHKLAVSRLQDMGPKTQFHRVLDEPDEKIAKNKGVKRVVLCSGKVYYDLFVERQSRKVKDVALIRVEQLYPFPDQELSEILQNYHKAGEVIWCQEEPENMGAWTFIDRRLEKVMKNLGMSAGRPQYVGRPASAATATGYVKRHEKMQKELVDKALTLD